MTPDFLPFLRDLKAYGVENNIPNVSRQTGEFLNMLVKIHGSKDIFEIGSANGYSTIYLAEAARANGGKLVTCDFSKHLFEEAKKNIAKVNLQEYVKCIFGDALEIIPKWEGTFDFVFIDGEKASYKDFLKAVEPKLNPGAVVCVDNVKNFPEKTKNFWDYVTTQKAFEYCAIKESADDELLILIFFPY